MPGESQALKYQGIRNIELQKADVSADELLWREEWESTCQERERMSLLTRSV